MKTKSILITLISTIMLVTCLQGVLAQSKKNKKDSNKETIELYVSGMHCKNCQKKIEKNITYEKGITGLEVNLETKIVKISYKKDKTNLEKIQAAFKKLGYETEIAPNKAKLN